MGNAGAKEGENGHVVPSPSAAAGGEGISAAVTREQPPAVPSLYTPQVPAAALQRPPEFSPTNGAAYDAPQEKGIPTLITWTQGGNDVLVEGSWDNWSSRYMQTCLPSLTLEFACVMFYSKFQRNLVILRKALQKSGKDHAVLLVLPSGLYHYKIIVDREPRHAPELPHVIDEKGQVANLLDVHDHVPENLDSVAEFEGPPSPEPSYDLQLPGYEEFAKEPPALPPQLPVSVLGSARDSDDRAPKPQHVTLNHLFIEKGWGAHSLLALGVTHRFHSKYVSFVLYKPLRR